MSENLVIALIMMLVGMGIVFFVLYILVALGKLKIEFVKDDATEKLDEKVKHAKQSLTVSIEKSKLVAIVTAIDMVTNGKGNVVSVEKIN